MRRRVWGWVGAWGILGLAGGCAEAAAPPEPVPVDGLPASVEELIIGSDRACGQGAECASGACSFGVCRGLLSSDAPWQLRAITARLADALVARPALWPRVEALLTAVATDGEERAVIRGRAAVALAELVKTSPDSKASVIKVLRDIYERGPAPLTELSAGVLAELEEPIGVAVLVTLAAGSREAVALEALYALGRLKGAPPAARHQALVALLEALSPEASLEVQRAAAAGLGTLGDGRAIRPLVAALSLCPEALGETIGESLRALAPTGPRGGDVLAWDTWVNMNKPPVPPKYEMQKGNSEEDIGLPTP